MLVVALAISIIVAVLMSVAVPQFASVFEGLGAELPLLSQLLVEIYWLVWILPIAVLACRFIWPDPNQRRFLMLCFGVIAPLALIPVVIFAMYLPMFHLADAL